MKAERRRQITAPRPPVDKRTVWAEIRRRNPVFAAGLEVLCKAFGKPAGLRVEIDGDVLIDTLASRHEAQGLAPPIRETMGLTRATTSAAPYPAARQASDTLPAVDDLRTATPEQLARMKAALKRKAKTRERR